MFAKGSTIKTFIILSASAFAFSAAIAQTVPSAGRPAYKCVDGGKVVYTDEPCRGAAKVMTQPPEGSGESRAKAVGVAGAVSRASQPAYPSSGAAGQSLKLADQWGPDSFSPLPMPESEAIKMMRPSQSGSGNRSPASRDMLPFAGPPKGAMTPCGIDNDRTSFFYRPRMEVDSQRNYLRWECQYRPTGWRAESKVEIDCDKKLLTTSSIEFFKDETALGGLARPAPMRRPKPDSLEEKLLQLACALAQPTARELGQPGASQGAEALLRRVDSCLALAAGRWAGARDIHAQMISDCKTEVYDWLFACAGAGGSEHRCRETLDVRVGTAIVKSRSR